VSFYRERRRWPALVAVAVAALLAGGILGGMIGRASAPSLAERVSQVREDAAGVVTRLRVLETEYPQAVRGGRVVGPTEYEGARARAEAAHNALENLAGDLGRIDARGLAEARRAMADLRRAIAGRREPAEVFALVARVQAALRPAEVATPAS